MRERDRGRERETEGCERQIDGGRERDRQTEEERDMADIARKK